MFDKLKHWFGRGGSAAATADVWPELADWAQGRQSSLRPAKGGEGFVIEGRLGANPWRLEWGPSQRPYIQGSELRLRAELSLAPDIQVMLLDRGLQAAMETSVFEQYVESVQTRIDNRTPPEMRWLVMFPKVTGAELGALKEHFAGVSSVKQWLGRWLEGPLSAALATAPLSREQPLVLMISRGRLGLRTALAEPTPAQVKAWVSVFETAIRESRRLGKPLVDPAAPHRPPGLWFPGDSAADEPPRQR